MTRDEIDDLMRDNGIVIDSESVYVLCQLVAAEEREACAVIAFNAKTYLEAAAQIRARGQV